VPSLEQGQNESGVLKSCGGELNTPDHPTREHHPMSSIPSASPRSSTASEFGKNRPNLQVSGKLTTSPKTAILPDNRPSAPLELTREDWTEFRDPSRISAKAGVRWELLPRVVVKELVDNALDNFGSSEFGLLTISPAEVSFFVEDLGDGIPGSDEEIATRFSMRRPLTSSKTLRKPTRGMLGNGLRVVAGVVFVSKGELKVSTRGRSLTLAPQFDGSTKIVSVEPWNEVGTRIEITLRGDLARHAAPDDGLFDWGEIAVELASTPSGELYKGKSSPWWYGPAEFLELLHSAGTLPVESLIKEMEGCSGYKKLREVVGSLLGKTCKTVAASESEGLLERARNNSKEVIPTRIGCVGRLDYYSGYAVERNVLKRGGASVPCTVEVWATRSEEPEVEVCVNRTPIVSEVHIRRDEGSNYALFCGGIGHSFKAGQKRGGEFSLLINVITPFIPLTSSGKEPDLTPMRSLILTACEKAISRAKRASPKESSGGTQKAIILQHLEPAVERLSGRGTCYFSLRQLFYALRPLLIKAIGREPGYGTFSRIIGKYEDQEGDIEWLYRDDRGTLYHPHTGERFNLGTRSVASYKRPEWGFNKILYSEKEGFFPILQQAEWPERFDCALLTSKGFATRAAREVLRLIQGADEPITFFCIHDADGPGTVIFEKLAEALEGDGISVVNLGLDPAEGREMRLQDEPVERKKKKGGKSKQVPVAEYIPETDRIWLQTHRIELNAMDTPQFLGWLTGKLSEHDRGKVIPPAEIVQTRMFEDIKELLTDRIVKELVRKADVPNQVDGILKAMNGELVTKADSTANSLAGELSTSPKKHWSEVAKTVACEVVEAIDISKVTVKSSSEA